MELQDLLLGRIDPVGIETIELGDRGIRHPAGGADLHGGSPMM